MEEINLELRPANGYVIFTCNDKQVMTYRKPRSERIIEKMFKDLKAFITVNKITIDETEFKSKDLLRYKITQAFVAWVSIKGTKTVTKGI